jgi:hypothetical protein
MIGGLEGGSAMSPIKTAALMFTLAMSILIAQQTRVLAAGSITEAQMPDRQCRDEANRKSSAAASERVAYYDQCMARKSKGQK